MPSDESAPTEILLATGDSVPFAATALERAAEALFLLEDPPKPKKLPTFSPTQSKASPTASTASRNPSTNPVALLIKNSRTGPNKS